MTIKVLTQRIEGPMLFELVRDQIAAILEAELANQQALAIADGDDPTPYEISVTTEKSIPWSVAQMPLVNVYYDDTQISSKSSMASAQQGEHTYIVDCYAAVQTQADATDISSYGDEEAARYVQFMGGLVFRILMATINATLQFPAHATDGTPIGVIGSRIIRSLQPFRPAFGDKPIEDVMALRCTLVVRHPEFIPSEDGVILDEILATFRRDDTTEGAEVGALIQYTEE